MNLIVEGEGMKHMTEFDISAFLRTCRTKQGGTQSEIAKLCRVHKDTYRSWERGQSLPCSEVVPRIAAVYAWKKEDHEKVLLQVKAKQHRHRSVGFSMKPTKTALGAFLRQQRLARGLKQSEVASLCHVSLVCYNLAEKGDTFGERKGLLSKLAIVLGCKLGDLLALIPKEIFPEPKTPLGYFIRARRIELELTLETLAARMSMSLQKMKRLELGKTDKPNKPAEFLCPSIIPRLAKALEVEPKILVPFFIEGNEKPIENKLGENELGVYIRHRRKELGFTSRQLALAVEISRQYMSYIERGVIPLVENNDLLKKIALKLDVDPDVLCKIRRGRKSKVKQKIVSDPC